MTPKEMLQQAILNFQHNYRVAAIQYTYMERDEERDGTEKTSVGKVSPVNGLPYEFEIERNGKPLSPEQQTKEQAKLDRRRRDGKEQQVRRIREYEHDRAFLDEVADAFLCKQAADETLHGRSNYLLDCSANPSYHAIDSHAAMFSHIRARIWIDKEDLQMSRADAKVLDTIAFGWVLARIGAGAEMRLEQTRLTHTDWLPSLIDVNGTARILLVHDRPIHELITYYDFKPITTTSDATNISESQAEAAGKPGWAIERR